MMNHVEGGVAVLQDWSKLWVQGEITQEMASVWTVAVVHPVDCGEAKSADLGERKAEDKTNRVFSGAGHIRRDGLS